MLSTERGIDKSTDYRAIRSYIDMFRLDQAISESTRYDLLRNERSFLQNLCRRNFLTSAPGCSSTVLPVACDIYRKYFNAFARNLLSNFSGGKLVFLSITRTHVRGKISYCFEVVEETEYLYILSIFRRYANGINHGSTSNRHSYVDLTFSSIEDDEFAA